MNWLLLLMACGDAPQIAPTLVAPEPEPTPAELPYREPLDPVPLLTRISLDLRGVRPSADELRRIQANPDSLDSFIETCLHSPLFEERIVDLFAERYHIRDDFTFVRLPYYENRYSYEQMWESLGEEPLRILARIAVEDRPYTEIVTADWTVIDHRLATMWPVTYPAGAQGWQVSAYTDRRPMAGVLSTNSMWWQHGSMENNLNRGRANQILRILLCNDMLESEIDFAVDEPFTSTRDVDDAIREDPQCAACHHVIDPIASNLYGFWYFASTKNNPGISSTYHPEWEQVWSDVDQPPPAYWGEPTHGLQGLGQAIADDPNLLSCFVDTSWDLMLRRPPTREEAPETERLNKAFIEGGATVRALFRALVTSPTYQSAAEERLVTPQLLSSQVEHLTGFGLTTDGWDRMDGPYKGYHALAGGSDEVERTAAIREPNPTLVLVHQRLVEGATMWALSHDDAPAGPLLPTRRTDVTDEELALGLVRLHANILSELVEVDHPDIVEEIALWRAVEAETGRVHDAWLAVLQLLLRDPRFLIF